MVAVCDVLRPQEPGSRGCGYEIECVLYLAQNGVALARLTGERDTLCCPCFSVVAAYAAAC